MLYFTIDVRQEEVLVKRVDISDGGLLELCSGSGSRLAHGYLWLACTLVCVGKIVLLLLHRVFIDCRLVETIICSREQAILVYSYVVGGVCRHSSKHLLLLIGRDLVKKSLVVALDVVSFISEELCLVLKLEFLCRQQV